MAWGRKTEIKKLALQLRAETGLSPYDAADPFALCDYLAIPVLLVSGFQEVPKVVAYFAGPGEQEFSAVTAFLGTDRFIIVNDFHHPNRQRSSLAHELGHAMLFHPPAPVLRGDGIRNWQGEIEEDAAFLGGVLLVPDEAARRIAVFGTPVPQAARALGVSESLMEYRLNVSGARVIAKRARARRR